MYFDNAKTLASDVIWYKAPDGAKPLPFPSLFGSETSDTYHWWCPGAGEDDSSRSSYYNGKIPGPFKGRSYCGPQQWWTNGCPSDAPRLSRNAAGLPSCCFGRGAYSTAFSDAWDVFRGVKK